MKTIAEQLLESQAGHTLMTDSDFDYLEQQIPGLTGAAVSVAHLQALASGQKVLVSGEGGLYQAFPDGTRKLVKPLEKPLSVPVGTKVKIP